MTRPDIVAELRLLNEYVTHLEKQDTRATMKPSEALRILTTRLEMVTNTPQPEAFVLGVTYAFNDISRALGLKMDANFTTIIDRARALAKFRQEIEVTVNPERRVLRPGAE